MRPLFHSSLQDNLGKLARNEYASDEERDALLQAVFEAQNIKPRDVVWMAYRPERFLREGAVRLLRRLRSTETINQFVVESKGKTEAALRAATEILFGLRIPGIEKHLTALLAAEDENVRDATQRLIFEAPVTPALSSLFWNLAESQDTGNRSVFLERLTTMDLAEDDVARWIKHVHDDDPMVRATALKFLGDKRPVESVDLIVDNLARVDYATQQHLITALNRVAPSLGAGFVDRLLPLMASGEAGTRSAVIKIFLSLENRHDLVKNYLKFSKGLAGWARDRALDSMKEFGNDLIEPTIELLSDPDDEVRTMALVVAGSFDDPRIIPATISLLKDDDWWLRVTAADTLGRFKDDQATAALVATLDDPEARWAAVEALGRIADPRSLQPLAKLLADPAPEVRIEVLLALRNFDHPKILEALQKVASSDPDRAVRGRALEIAEKVAKRTHTPIENGEELRESALKIEVSANEPRLHGLLVETRNRGGSDFHLAVGLPPMVRESADLVSMGSDRFSSGDCETMIREILTEAEWQKLEEEQQLDLCYYIPRAGRYRTNLFLDHKGYNGVFRVIPEKPPTIAEIGLPGHLEEIAAHHQGLVLVCGPSGCGKTTTLAALVNLFNETRQSHIITLEEPVEFVHPFKNCLINQREIGPDTRSYARALRGALREDPDVIVIGDLRDTEAIALALTAAETGHIVLGTLSSTTAPKAIDRIITSFGHTQQPQIRVALAESLKYVIAQRLLPVDGARERVACFEILKATMSVANLIREEKTYQLQSAMQLGRTQGMQTFDEALRELVRKGTISAESAYLHAANRDDFESEASTEEAKDAT
ncbi:MAG: PilT/PilU family type 4a pilus ATPase [Thermoanaerobaculales bacterium]|nr:PilT/PilU family type 4a pilus ATPase [Thermoanaerobaculales bacterium]